MSAQAGILYSDLRQVPAEALGALTVGNTAVAPDGISNHVGIGVGLLSFAWHFDTLSIKERQPVQTSDGAVMTFDGRLDNREDLLARLSDMWTDDVTDARLAALACEKWTDEAWLEILGDWSIARWDGRRSELTLACDYTGNRPLFFCAQPDCFVWSTALEALVDFCGLVGQACDEYFAAVLTNTPFGNLTPHRNILRVPAGHVVRARVGQPLGYRQWHRFRDSSIRYVDSRDYEEHYRSLLTQAVKVRLRSRSPVWPELSGGYDSSSITCLANQLVRARAVEAPSLHPVSWVMPHIPESDESTYIASVERFCQLQSTRITLPAAYQLEAQPDVSHQTFSSSSGQGAATLMAREGSHVLLSGEFGDVLTDVDSPRRVLRDYLSARRWSAFFTESVRHCRVTRGSLIALWRDTFRTAPIGFDNPVLKGLADFVALGILDGGREGPYPVRIAYPFAHRPLVDFIRSIPVEALWRADRVRPLVCQALRDVLPAAILSRQTKGFAAPATDRLYTPTLMEELEHDRVKYWQLVARGYAAPETVTKQLRQMIDGQATSHVAIGALFRTESLLRCQRLRLNTS